METSARPGQSPQNPGVDERIKTLFAQRNYEIIGELGRGGMGIVYLAQHTKLGRRVAIKTLTPERRSRENSLRRFLREARTFAQIRHNHIATLFEFEDQGPLHFLALEYIEGTDLERERRKGRKWTQDEVARITQTVAASLNYTHKKGILHRDIKPGNILMERNTNRIVLTDFGLAKGEQDETLTASGFAVGTPAYMAPEQITDQFGVKPDGRADIFSLGTVAYEMLTGKHPFLAADDLKTMRAIVSQEPTKPSELNPEVSASLELLILSMLVKDPTNRPTAEQVEARLGDWLTKKAADETLTIPPPKAPSDSGTPQQFSGAENQKTAQLGPNDTVLTTAPAPKAKEPEKPADSIQPTVKKKTKPAKTEEAPVTVGLSPTLIAIIVVVIFLILVIGIMIGVILF